MVTSYLQESNVPQPVTKFGKKRQDKEYLKFLHETKTKDVEDETAIFDCRPVDQ